MVSQDYSQSHEEVCVKQTKRSVTRASGSAAGVMVSRDVTAHEAR